MSGARGTVDRAHAERGTGAQAIARAACVLRLIARNTMEGARLADLTRLSGLPHSTLHRILRCLAQERFVVQDPSTRRYQLGPINFELGLATMHKTEFQRRFRPHLERIAAASSDTVYLVVRSGNDFVCLDRVEGIFPARAIMLHVGGRRPLFLGAAGLALLAALDPCDAERYLQGSAREVANYPGLSVDGLRRAVERTRTRGYGRAKDNAHLGVGSIAVTIPEREHVFRFAVSVATKSNRLVAAREREIHALLTNELRRLGPG